MVNVSSPRAAIMMVFAAFGTSVGAWAGAIPLVTDASHIDKYALGVGFTVSALATVGAMSLGGYIGRHISNRAMLLATIPLVALVTMGLLLSSAPVPFFAWLILYGAILGILDVFMNAEASAIEHDVGRPIFTAFHGCVSLTIALFAILSSYVSNLYGPWATSLAVIALLALAWFMVYAQVPARLREAKPVNLQDIPVSRLPLVLMGLIVGISVAAETTSVFWSAKLLSEQAPNLAVIAGLGASFYGLCNAIMRFAGDRLRAIFGDLPLMLASLATAILGFTVLGISHSFALSTLAFAGVGFGLAVLCPCIFNMAASEMPENRAAGISFVSMVAGPPRIAAPWAFGWIATQTSTSSAFGLCGIILAAAFLLVLCLRSVQAQHRSASFATNVK